MSLDRRVREELDRLASAIEPDVEPHLQASLRRAGARSRGRRVAFALAFAVVIAVVIIGPGMLRALRSETFVGSDGSPAAREPLTGKYMATVAVDDPDLQQHALSGEWMIEFGDDGILGVSAPAEFSGTRTGYSFELTGDQLRTNLFNSDVCSGLLPGTYRWQLDDGTLALTVIDDSCPGRAALLAAEPWSSTSDGE